MSRASKPLGLLGVALLCGLTSAQVIINEVLADPPNGLAGDANRDGVRDAAQDEFVEVLNLGGVPADISGWRVGDDDDPFLASFAFPPGTILPAGACAVVFGGGAPAPSFGAFVFTDNGTIGNGLGNSGERVLLWNSAAVVMDTFVCTGSGATNCGDDTSFVRIPEGTLGVFTMHDTVAPTAFSPAANIAGAACNVGTPPPPVGQQFNPGDLIITEIMQDPSVVADASGEYFEIFNNTSATVDLLGLRVRDDGIDSFVISSSVMLAPCEYAILARNGDPSVNGGVVGVDYVYGTMMALANADDEVVLVSGVVEVDRVNYDGGLTFPDPTGASMELICAALDNNLGANWRVATASIGGAIGRDLGSPGEPNGSVTLVCADVVVAADAGACDAWVLYAISGTDSCGAPITSASVSCTPAEGSVFPVGVTSVSCTLTDANCATAVCGFSVTVEDREVPALSCPARIDQDADVGSCDALVTYAVTATDNCPGVTTACSPASGSLFPVGSTVVNCTATDAAGNQSFCAFDVVIADAEAPTITCPAAIAVDSEAGLCGASVTYLASASDNCPGTTLTCTPASGTFFPVGVTLVACEAIDAAGNTAACDFEIEVRDTEAPTIDCNASDVRQMRIPRSSGSGSGSAGPQPVCITALADDNCSVDSVVVSGLTVTRARPGGRPPEPERADIEVIGDTLCIYDSGRVGSRIEWTVTATDSAGNVTVTVCGINVIQRR